MEIHVLVSTQTPGVSESPGLLQHCCCNSGRAGDKVPGTLPDARMKEAKQESKSPRTDPYRGSQ